VAKRGEALVHLSVIALGFVVVHQIAFRVDVAVNLAFGTFMPAYVERRQRWEELKFAVR